MAVSVVPWFSRAHDRQPAAEGLDARLQALQAGAVGGAAPPVPSSATVATSVRPWSTTSTSSARRVGVLDRVGERLGDQEPDRGLDDVGQAALGQRDDLDRQRRLDAERGERARQAALEPDGMQAAGELAQLAAGHDACSRAAARRCCAPWGRARARGARGRSPGRGRRAAAARRRGGRGRSGGAPRRRRARRGRGWRRPRPRGRAARARGGGGRARRRRGRRTPAARAARSARGRAGGSRPARVADRAAVGAASGIAR